MAADRRLPTRASSPAGWPRSRPTTPRAASCSTTARATNFLNNANKNIPLPWLTPDNPVRIGSSATLHQPVILDFRNNLWELPADHPGDRRRADVATFSDTRAANQAPQDVGGDLQLATFNVENYFPTSGQPTTIALDAGNTCTSFNDRAGTRSRVNQCSPNGPAAAPADADQPPAPAGQGGPRRSTRLDADVVSLEEIENSVAVRRDDRDDALKSLVDALNADAGTTRWAYVAVARRGRPAADRRAGRHPDGVHLQPEHGAARRAVDGPGRPVRTRASRSRTPASRWRRSSSARARSTPTGSWSWSTTSSRRATARPPATGDNANGIQGAFNGDRVRQAHALVDFAKATVAGRPGTKKIFLVGDFNSYTQEDPMQVLYQNGLRQPGQRRPADTSYEFDGQAGSLDHVLANSAAADHGHRARRLADQRRGVGRLRVQPLQLQRHAALPAQPVPRLRPQPGARRPRASRSPSRPRRSRRPRRPTGSRRRRTPSTDRRHGLRRAGRHADRQRSRSWVGRRAGRRRSRWSTGTRARRSGRSRSAGTRDRRGALPR